MYVKSVQGRQRFLKFCGMQIKNTQKFAIFCPCRTQEIMESSYIQQLISESLPNRYSAL